MSIETAERTFRRVFERRGLVGTHLTVLWHGGEPLAMPPAHYREVFRLLKHYAPKDLALRLSIQTNGMLITQEWTELFREHNVKIGVSIDGPMSLHDANRIRRDGRGTYEATIRGMQALSKAGVQFGILAVITGDSVDHPEEVWSAFENLPVEHIALNFEEVQAGNLSSSLDRENIQGRVRSFLRVFLALRDRRRPDVRIRECDVPEERIYRRNRTYYRPLELIPLGIVNVAWNGDFSTFDPQLLGVDHPAYGTFVFGNVYRNEIMDALDNPVFKKAFTDIVSGINKCRNECDYYRICGGGSGSNKLYERGTFNSSETLACQVRIQAAADIATERLENKLGSNANSSSAEHIATGMRTEVS